MYNDYAEPGTYGRQWMAPQQSQQDTSSQLLVSILPLITTLPGIQQSEAATKALAVELAAIPVPPTIGGNPTQADYNTLRDYAVKVDSVVRRHVDTSTVAYGALRKQFLISLLGPLLLAGGNGAGGNNSMIMVVVMMMLFSSGGNLF